MVDARRRIIRYRPAARSKRGVMETDIQHNDRHAAY